MLSVVHLVAQVNTIFEEENPESALEEVIDGNLRGSYPMEEVYKVSLLISFLYNQCHII